MSTYEDNVQRMLRVLRDVFGETFAAYYDGDPEAIPLFNLPALIVTQTGTDIEVGAMGQDDVTDRLTIKVVFNKRDDFTNDKVDTLNMTERKIRDIIGKRDATTGDYGKQTVQYAVRTLAVEGITAIDTATNVEYGINPRPGGGDFADLTAEGHVSFGIQYLADTL